MRIVIDTEEGKKPSVSGEPTPEAEPGAAVPPPEVVARAAAIGAASAGPAPAAIRAEGSAPFITEPVTPAVGPEDVGDAAQNMSAGSAPGFATGPLETEQVEAEGEDEEADADDAGAES